MQIPRDGGASDDPASENQSSAEPGDNSIERRAFIKNTIRLLPYVVPVFATFAMPRQAAADKDMDDDDDDFDLRMMMGGMMMDVSPMGMMRGMRGRGD